MSTEPTEAEIEHGITLLRDTTQWEGHVAVVPIDSVCKWSPPDTDPCGKPLEDAVVLLTVGGKTAQVIAFCHHHANCMAEAVQKWRTMA